MGAGVSRSGGIRTATEIVARIRHTHPEAFAAAQRKFHSDLPRYPEVMEFLTVAERRAIFEDEMRNARLNPAHRNLARLMDHSVVQRLLTTNFDTLLKKAFLAHGIDPSIQDYGTPFRDGDRIIPPPISRPVVSYLHGTYDGRLQVNTPALLERQAQRVRLVLDEAIRPRLTLVAGYSGDLDELVKYIADIENFDHSLIWAVPGNEFPSAYVMETLFDRCDDTALLLGWPADDLFESLANDLGAPAFGSAQALSAQRMPALRMVAAPVQFYEPLRPWVSIRPSLSKETRRLFAERKFDELVSLYLGSSQTWSDRDLIRIAVAAYCAAKRRLREAEPTERAIDEAVELLQIALNLRPDYVNAKLDLAFILVERACSGEPGINRDCLLHRAEALIGQAIEAKPHRGDAWSLAGYLCFERAAFAVPADALLLLRQARMAFEHATSHCSIAVVLKDIAQCLLSEISLTSRDGLNSLIEPCRDLVRQEWGSPWDEDLLKRQAAPLLAIAARADPRVARDLYSDIYRFCEDALARNPKCEGALHLWGVVLTGQSTREAVFNRPNALRLLDQACVKFRQALAIEPLRADTMAQWGTALGFRSVYSKRRHIDKFDRMAEVKFRAAEALEPGIACYNLASLYARRVNVACAAAWLAQAFQGDALTTDDLITIEADFAAIRGAAEFKAVLALLKPGRGQAEDAPLRHVPQVRLVYPHWRQRLAA